MTSYFEQDDKPVKVYRGENAAGVFIENIQKEYEEVFQFLNTIIPMKPLTEDQQDHFNTATLCHICQKALTYVEKRVRDHDHYTGNLMFFCS